MFNGEIVLKTNSLNNGNKLRTNPQNSQIKSNDDKKIRKK